MQQIITSHPVLLYIIKQKTYQYDTISTIQVECKGYINKTFRRIAILSISF